MNTYLEDEILLLRALEPEDLEELYRWENDSSLWVYGSTLSPYSKYTLKLYIEQSAQQNIYELKQQRFIIEKKTSGKNIGLLDLFDYDPFHQRAGVGILIDKTYQKQGYAHRSLNLLMDYAFHFLSMHQLYAHIATDNENCIQLFQKSGFTEIGILKDWQKKGNTYTDVALYQRIAFK